jgi:hypothetical protein
MLVHDQATMWRLVHDRQEKIAADTERAYRRRVLRRRAQRQVG